MIATCFIGFMIGTTGVISMIDFMRLNIMSKHVFHVLIGFICMIISIGIILLSVMNMPDVNPAIYLHAIVLASGIAWIICDTFNEYNENMITVKEMMNDD